jgi:hypothetical protein
MGDLHNANQWMHLDAPDDFDGALLLAAWLAATEP